MYSWSQKVIAILFDSLHKGPLTILLASDVLPNLKLTHDKTVAPFLSNSLNWRNGVLRINGCMIVMLTDNHSVHYMFCIQKSSSRSGCLCQGSPSDLHSLLRCVTKL